MSVLGAQLSSDRLQAYLEGQAGSGRHGDVVRCSYALHGQDADQVYVSSLCLELVAEGDSIAAGVGQYGALALQVATGDSGVRVLSHQAPTAGAQFSSEVRRLFPGEIAAQLLDPAAATALRDALEQDLRGRSHADIALATEQKGAVARLIDPRIARGIAGQQGWLERKRVTADYDGDGVEEALVVISDATPANDSRSVFQGPRLWQAYVEERTGGRSYLYARGLKNGTLDGQAGRTDPGRMAPVLLFERAADSSAFYEVEYRESAARVLHEVRRAETPRLFGRRPR